MDMLVRVIKKFTGTENPILQHLIWNEFFEFYNDFADRSTDIYARLNEEYEKVADKENYEEFIDRETQKIYDEMSKEPKRKNGRLAYKNDPVDHFIMGYMKKNPKVTVTFRIEKI